MSFTSYLSRTGRRHHRWQGFFLLALCLPFLLIGCSSSHKTVLILGDSLSAGYKLQAGTSWVSLLENRIQTEKSRAKIVNASISGDSTEGGKLRLPILLAQHRPDIVILELGGNDGLRGNALEKTEDNLRAMITASKLSGAKVLLVGMKIPPENRQAYADNFATMYGKIASDTRVAIVPFMLEGFAENLEYFMDDRIHPTAEAQPMILDNIWPHLKPLMK